MYSDEYCPGATPPAPRSLIVPKLLLSLHRNQKQNNMITTVEDLCKALGYSLDDQEIVKHKLAHILIYLNSQDVIQEYSQPRLDWLFSDNEIY